MNPPSPSPESPDRSAGASPASPTGSGDAPPAGAPGAGLPSKERGGWLFLVFSSALCLAFAVLVAFVAFPAPPATQEPVEAHDDLASDVVDAPRLIVNLAGASGRRTLKATISFEVESPDAASGVEAFKKHLPWIQDLLIDLLSTAPVEAGPARAGLRGLIRDEVNRRLGEEAGGEGLRVIRVYLREFSLS